MQCSQQADRRIQRGNKNHIPLSWVPTIWQMTHLTQHRSRTLLASAGTPPIAGEEQPALRRTVPRNALAPIEASPLPRDHYVRAFGWQTCRMGSPKPRIGDTIWQYAVFLVSRWPIELRVTRHWMHAGCVTELRNGERKPASQAGASCDRRITHPILSNDRLNVRSSFCICSRVGAAL